MNHDTTASTGDSTATTDPRESGGCPGVRGETPVGRRELLGGGLALGGLLLVGCQSASSSRLPGPHWPSTLDEGGVITARPLPPPAAAAPPRVESAVPADVVARSSWTRSGVARKNAINEMNGVSRITVHHSAVNSNNLRSSAAVVREIEGIRSGHVGRGWADIGYHFIIDPFGRVYEGRATRYQGAHVEDNNEHNLGVMVLGNFDLQSPTPQAMAALNRFVRSQMSRYSVPLSRVYTHRELKATACPGRSLQQYMVRARAAGGGLA